MSKLRKVFGEYEMTWKRLIIFSVVCGFYTALVLMVPYIKDTALKEIGVGYECWFVLAIFVIVNCKTYKEAAIKCFIFFLISQPLVYIVQSIVTHENLLEAYYKPWFIQTIFTLPGAMIAYRIKKGDYLSSIILTVAGGFIGMSGVVFAIKSFNGANISYLIYGIILMVTSILLGLIFITNKKALIIYLVFVLVCSILVGRYATRRDTNMKHYDYLLTDENWDISSCKQNDMDVNVVNDVLKIDYCSSSAKAEIVLTNENNNTKTLVISITDDGVLVQEKSGE